MIMNILILNIVMNLNSEAIALVYNEYIIAKKER
jgi:hypothetical protein